MTIQDNRNRSTNLVRVGSLGMALSVLAAMLLAPSQAHAIIDGTFAETCAFPSVVRLVGTRSHSGCTGVYIGGRVMITAAHCFANDGYQLDHDVMELRTGPRRIHARWPAIVQA